MKKTFKITSLIIALILSVTMLASCGGPDVSLVKDGSPTDYPDMTWGEALEQVCTDCEWTSFVSEDDRSIVEFNGTMIGSESALCIQFEVDEADETFETIYMDIDGEECDIITMSAVIDEIFSE